MDKLAELLAEFLEKEGIVENAQGLDREWLKEVVVAFRERAKTLKEMAHQCDFLFKAPEEYDPKGVKKFFKAETATYLEALANELEKAESFDRDTIDQVFQKVLDTFGIKLKAVAQPVRLAITGRTVSPGLHEIILLTGKDEVIKRIRRAAAYIKGMQNN